MKLDELPESVLIHKVVTPWVDALDLLKNVSVVNKRLREMVLKALHFSNFLTIAGAIGENISHQTFCENILKPCAGNSLTYLRLQDCNSLTNDTMVEVSKLLPNLSSLSIIRCSSISSLDGSFPHLCYLETDSLHADQLNILKKFKSLKKLRLIGLTGILDHSALTFVLKDFETIEHLEIENGKDVDEQLLEMILSEEVVTRLKGLKVIGYINCRMNSVKWPRELPNLRELVVDGPAIDHTSAAIISKAYNITDLDLGSNCARIGDDGLKSLAETCTKLKRIRMRNISHFGFSLFADNCNLLESLTATECKGVGDLTLINLGNKCRNLTELDVSGCKGISDQGLVGLCTPGAPHPYDPSPPPKLPSNLVFPGEDLRIPENIHDIMFSCRLTKLNLAGCTALTNKGLKAIAECKRIQHLNLNGLYRLTDGGFIAFAEKCNTLITLDISWCFEVTLLSLEILINSIPPLSNLELEGCSNLHEDDLLNLQLMIRGKLKRRIVSNSAMQSTNEKVVKRSKPKKKGKAKKPVPDFDAILNSNDLSTSKKKKSVGKKDKLKGKGKTKTKTKKNSKSDPEETYVAFKNIRKS